MATFTKFQPFVEKLAEGVFNLQGDTLKIALCAAANAPVATNGLLGDLTQISYTNLSSRTLTVVSSAQTSGTYKLVVSDLTLTASGGAVATWRYIVVYDDTPSGDPLIGWFDYGGNLTLNDGEGVLLDFDGTAGLLTLV